MENNSNKYITVAYELYVEDGGKESMVEQAPAEHPFQFISGMGITLEAFEENIAKLNKGDKFDFVIPMADAYGEIDPTHILDLPKHFFEIDGQFDAKRVFVGNILPMVNSDGNHLNGTVVEIKDDSVRMDFNHPLAGETLHFSGEVLDVHEPTAEEIAELTSPHGGCGCGCDDCGGGCGEHEHGGSCGCGGCH